MAGQSYRDLIVWQKSMAMVTKIYQVTEKFPRSESFGLTSQIRRAAVSVPSNIAEGQGRDSAAEFARYLSFAYGSLCEVETQLQIAANLGYVGLNSVKTLFDDTSEIGRMLNGLSRSVKR